MGLIPHVLWEFCETEGYVFLYQFRTDAWFIDELDISICLDLRGMLRISIPPYQIQRVLCVFVEEYRVVAYCTILLQCNIFHIRAFGHCQRIAITLEIYWGI